MNLLNRRTLGRLMGAAACSTLLQLGLATVTAAQLEPLLTMQNQPWGTIRNATNGTGVTTLEIANWPTEKGWVLLPTPFPEITAAYLVNGLGRNPLPWVFNLNATKLYLEAPTRAPGAPPNFIELETAEKTGSFPGGRVVLSAADARVQGTHAKLESHPGNNRIGFWLDPTDTVTWEYKPTRWGMYDLEMTYAAQDGDGTEMEFEIAGKKLSVARPPTGSWYRYQTLRIGRFYLEKAQPFTVRVSCKKMTGQAVANLKALTLRPAPESPPVTQVGEQPVVLAASNAITHSVTMRYEPATNKNCLGYWVNASDWAEWPFTLTKPGTYEVEVSHGAGKNQGGDILVEVNGQPLAFTTADTGDIHKHTALKIGHVKFYVAGEYFLTLKPQRKNNGAIMDLGEIKLVRIGNP